MFDTKKKDRSNNRVAKNLRAWSLFIQLISELAPLKILRKLHLPAVNSLMASGGSFGDIVRNMPAPLDMKKEQVRHDPLTVNRIWNPLTFSLPQFFGDERVYPSFGKFNAPQTDQCPLEKESRMTGQPLNL